MFVRFGLQLSLSCLDLMWLRLLKMEHFFLCCFLNPFNPIDFISCSRVCSSLLGKSCIRLCPWGVLFDVIQYLLHCRSSSGASHWTAGRKSSNSSYWRAWSVLIFLDFSVFIWTNRHNDRIYIIKLTGR